MGEGSSRSIGEVSLIRKPATSEPLLSVKNVAAWLQVSEAWVRQHASGQRRPKQPEIPCIRLGANVRFRRSDIEAFIEKLSAAAGSLR